MKMLTLFLLLSMVARSASIGSDGYQQERTIGDLPLKILESKNEPTLPMVVFISGDGGFNSFTESLCKYLSQNGFPVVVLDSKKYFWDNKTPVEATNDLISIVDTYKKLWNRGKFVLAGFSFGASLVPFMVNRLPENVGKDLTNAILINPDQKCDFEVHLSDMLNLGIAKGNYDVIKEIQKCDTKRIAVFFGSDESSEVRELFQQTGFKVQVVAGNHHFDNGYKTLADLLMNEMKGL